MSRTYYFIYLKIPKKIFNDRLQYLLFNSYDFHADKNDVIGLYGYTKDKQIAKSFIKSRNKKLFYMIKKELTKKEENHILDKKSDLALGYHRFSSQINDKVKEVDVLTTVNEYNTVEYNSDEYLYEFGPSADINYNIFNDDIIDALSTLGYVSNYILHHGSVEDMDLLLYNESFGIDINGKNKVPQSTDKLGSLLYLYYILFDKESVGDLCV